MQLLLFTVALLATGHCVPLGEITTFEQFKIAFNKSYATAQEESLRRANFERSLQWIQANQDKFGAHMAINEMADLSEDEFAAPAYDMAEHDESYYGGIINVQPEAHLPAHFDWREKVQMRPIENQGRCGSCWAYAAANSMESALSIKHRVFVTLSKQELVDCTRKTYDHNYHNNGCHGGFPWEAFKYAQQHGILEQAVYPYKALDNEACYTSRVAASHKRYHINDYHRLGMNARDEVLQTIIKNHGPISVHIYAHHDPFKHYKSGILRNVFPGSTKITHAVTVVGWGTEHGVDYWVLRNSWGTNWGEHGYGKVERHHNLMGMNHYVSYPIVN